MTRTLFHGTTYKNYESILKEGFNPKTKTWTCSDEDSVYFYDMSKDCNCILEDGDEDDLKNDLVRQALSNAQISASIQGYMESTLVVLELEVNEDDVEDDYSCDNMEGASCVEIDCLTADMIKAIHISEDAYNPHMRFFYVSDLMGMTLLNTDVFNEMELRAIELISSIDDYIEELNEYDWETTKL